ncbi:MAG: hypothetical protein ACFFED_00535 [Candidatus Thorarchaeota archaeon]
MNAICRSECLEIAPEYKRKELFAKADIKAKKELVKLFEAKTAPELYFALDGEIIGFVNE